MFARKTTIVAAFSATAVLFWFTVALQRLRLSVLYVYSIMNQAWYNDHQIWNRSLTADEGIYSSLLWTRWALAQSVSLIHLWSMWRSYRQGARLLCEAFSTISVLSDINTSHTHNIVLYCDQTKKDTTISIVHWFWCSFGLLHKQNNVKYLTFYCKINICFSGYSYGHTVWWQHILCSLYFYTTIRGCKQAVNIIHPHCFTATPCLQ